MNTPAVESIMDQGKENKLCSLLSIYVLHVDLQAPSYELDGMLKHSLGELLEHEYIKMEEDTPRHWASCRGWSCGLSLQNVLWITILCVISTCLAVYVSGKSIVGNNAQHPAEAPQIQITSTMASQGTNVLTDQTLAQVSHPDSGTNSCCSTIHKLRAYVYRPHKKLPYKRR